MIEDKIDALLQKMPDTAIPVTEQQWQLSQVVDGAAEVHRESSEQLLPQELNFQLLDGVSFNKGCYTGQEIVARMHYKATLKKHLYLGSTTAPVDNQIEYGNPVLSGDKKVGQVITSVKDHNGIAFILALMDDNTLSSGCAIAGSENPVKLEWRELPYAIPKG